MRELFEYEIGHDSRAVANEILNIAERSGLKLTPMQVLKLAYLAHGWSLSLLDRPLSKHAAQAWQYGPVIPQIYRAFSRFGASHVDELARDKSTGIEIREAFSDSEIELMDAVVDG